MRNPEVTNVLRCCSRHQHNSHRVGVTGTGTPAGDNDGHIPRLEELAVFAWREEKMGSAASLNVSSLRAEMVTLSALTDFHGEAHTHVDVLSPHVVGGFGVEHGVDAAVQVGLAGCLTAAGQSNDGGAGPVP